jgi:predicted nucleic acid-binding protein
MIDANLIIAMFVRRGDHPLMRWSAGRKIRPVLCAYMLDEARRMVSRAFRARAAELPALLDALQAEALPEPSPEDRARYGFLVSDPADHPVVAAALLAGVDFLVTSDRRLREDAAGSLACRRTRLRVVSVPELAAILDRRTA